ncbi:cilia- and flagella-associated protein 69-like isoform X1 [Diabrotica undecimpunctata]|uniref:cilia- and flagella-associated protein 69-like isoform X1 n=1 Tax=Diabrotica undecimpunctata TaxID=50387 RepID=UPI003B64135B
MNINNNCSCIYPTPSSTLLNKIICLLEYQVTQNDIPRVCAMISCYLENSKQGFLVVDLPNIMTLLEILSDGFDTEPLFRKILADVLQICKIPILLTRSSDILRYSIDLQEYFSVLGYVLLRVQCAEYQKLVLNILISLLQEQTEEWKNQVTLEKRQEAAMSGRFPQILAQLLFIADDDLFPKLLELTFKLLVENLESCKLMLPEDVINSLLIRIEDNWRNRYPDAPVSEPHSDLFLGFSEPPSFSNLTLITSIVNLIGIYLNSNKDMLQNVPVISRLALWNVRYVYVYVTIKQKNPSARNFLLTAVIWILELFPNIDFVPSGLAQDLLNTTFQEVSTLANNLLVLKCTLSEDDFVYLQLFIYLVPLYLKYRGGKLILERSRIIYRLLKIISSPTEKIPNPREHACVIKVISYKMLNALVPHLEDEFIENCGPPILLKNIRDKVNTESGLILLSKCLDTLRQILQYDPRKFVRHSVLFNHGDDIIIELSQTLLEWEIFTERAQVCLQEIFPILSILFRNNEAITRVHSLTLVEISIRYLQRIFKPKPNEPVYDNKIMISLIDFIWEVIVKNEQLSDMFYKRDGVYLMLDVLQEFPAPIKIITLGALVDLCDFGKGKCIPYLITWRGSNGMTLLPLLMEIFRLGNKYLDVKTGRRGEIADEKHPLMGKDQYIATFTENKLDASPAMTDMFASCRPKIYALLTLIQDRYKDILDVANEAYKTWDDNLQAKDKVTLLLAENFLGLKLGEMWEELKLKFELMKFEPLPIDAYIINSLVERTHQWGAQLKEVQIDILKHELADNLLDELNTYQQLKDARISEALESMKEAKYLARCTERIFRIAQTYKQAAQADRSVEEIAHGPLLHKTFLCNSRVTPVFKQLVTITDEKVVREDSSQLVSPKESAHLMNYDEKSASIMVLPQKQFSFY